MRIRDGCATVSGYELPLPLVKNWEGGSKAKPQVRISAGLRSSRSSGSDAFGGPNFSAKEKDEARL